jgi:hypothetical protein
VIVTKGTLYFSALRIQALQAESSCSAPFCKKHSRIQHQGLEGTLCIPQLQNLRNTGDLGNNTFTSCAVIYSPQ